jgi:hypothetical protein
MPTRASKNKAAGKPKRPMGPSLLAQSVVEGIIGETMEGGNLPMLQPPPQKNAAAVALSMLGASKGGIARAEALSPRKRKMIAKLAAQARWGKQ